MAEEGLNLVPPEPETIVTPSGVAYEGLRFGRGVQAVTIMRGGQAMEAGLRECCKGLRVGHVLISHTPGADTAPEVYYAKLGDDIASRTVLLLDPVICMLRGEARGRPPPCITLLSARRADSGATVVKALELLQAANVDMKRVVMLSLFAKPAGLAAVFHAYPDITVVTAGVHDFCCDPAFSLRYFGHT